jgi:hypothetical protein
MIVQTMESENTIRIASLPFIVEIGCSFVLVLIVLSLTGCCYFPAFSSR